MDPAASGPHVVMLVANDVSGDARVTKSAASVRRAGYAVTVVGTTIGNEALDETIDGIRLLRVRVGTELRDRPTAPTVEADPLTLSPYGARVRTIEHKAALREMTAQIGRLRRELDALPARRARRRRRELQRRVQALKEAAGRRQSDHEAWQAAWEERRESGPPSAEERAAAADAAIRTPWRAAVPWILDLEAAMAPVVDRLEADLLHAHDYHAIGIAVDAADRAAARGRRVAVVYDAHEFVPGIARPDDTTVHAYTDLEAEYLPRVDAVVTVSDPLADLLVEHHGLEARPTVVLNSPLMDADRDVGDVPSLRAAIGVPADRPLLLYSGGVTAARGVHSLVDALAELPGWHLALVAPRSSRFLRQLLARAEERGVGDRTHLAPFVPNHQVSTYLAEATIGVHPLVSGYVNHEIALPNKLFEYLHAGLPLVVSDCRAMAGFVREAGVGEVFTSGSASSLAEAVRRLEGDLDGYRSNIDVGRYGWEQQEQQLLSCYQRLGLSPGPELPERPRFAPASTAPPPVPPRLVHTLPGPDGWRSTLEGHGIEVWSFARAGSEGADAADVVVADRDLRARDWQLGQIRWLETEQVRHALLDPGTGLLGQLLGGRVEHEVPLLQSLGITVGVVVDDAAQAARFRALGVTLFTTSSELASHEPDVTWLPDPAGPEPEGPSDLVTRSRERLAAFLSTSRPA